MRRILKRFRRSVGVEELDRIEPSDTALRPPSEYAGASIGTLTWSEGGLRESLMVLTGFLKCKDDPQRIANAPVLQLEGLYATEKLRFNAEQMRHNSDP